jgi:hypothetical protein
MSLSEFSCVILIKSIRSFVISLEFYVRPYYMRNKVRLSILTIYTVFFQVESGEKDMDVDTPPAAGQSHASQKQSVLPEVEIFCYLLVTIFLIDQKQLEEVRILYPGRSSILTVGYFNSFDFTGVGTIVCSTGTGKYGVW